MPGRPSRGLTAAAVLCLLPAALASAAGLIDAVRSGDHELAHELIASGFDVNSVAGDGSTALLAAGAEIDSATLNGETPLMAAARTGSAAAVALLLQHGSDPDTYGQHMTLTYDPMHLAFQGDITRVFAFLLGHEGSSRSYAHVGVAEPYHPVSHHGDRPEGIEKYARITIHHVVKLAEFIGKLASTPDGDGTLLDSAVLYWGSGMSDGNTHDRHNPPALVIGHANGRLRGNRHIVAQHSEPTANLLLAMADIAGVGIDAIGDSTGRFDI